MPQISSILFLLSAYGWGCACRALCDRRILRFHSLTAVVGLGILSFVGGLLNLAGCATALVLFVLLAAGVLVAALDLLKTRPWRDFSRTSARSTANSARKQRHKSVFLVLLAALPGIVACFLLMPTSVFNLYDDFHTYVTRVVRMAQTGSVGGNVFDNSGLDGLGSQSFFQGFFLFGTDIRLLNGFDAVACFSLCLLLTAELSVRWRLPFFTGTLAILCLVVINPQYVNISPLYSGVLLVMSLILCGAVLAGSLLNDRLRRTRGLEMVTSLFATLLVTL